MDMNDAIAKEINAEKERRAQNSKRPLTISRGQLKAAKIIFVIGAIVIDVATGYAIWQITEWWYGALAALAGAGGLIYSDWLRERVGNNIDQKDIAVNGLTVSWVAIALSALTFGTLYVLEITREAWVMALALSYAVGIFFYHVIQSYRFYILDDEYIERNEEAREIETHERDLRSLHRAGRTVDHKKEKLGIANVYQQKHGAAFGAAYGKDVEQAVLRASPRTTDPNE